MKNYFIAFYCITFLFGPLSFSKVETRKIANDGSPVYVQICGDNGNLNKAINDFSFFTNIPLQKDSPKFQEHIAVNAALNQFTESAVKLCEALKAYTK